MTQKKDVTAIRRQQPHDKRYEERRCNSSRREYRRRECFNHGKHDLANLLRPAQQYGSCCLVPSRPDLLHMDSHHHSSTCRTAFQMAGCSISQPAMHNICAHPVYCTGGGGISCNNLINKCDYSQYVQRSPD